MMDNTSGIQPIEYKVLIKQSEIEDTDPTLKAAKAAGIHLPDEVREREGMKQVEAVIVAVGGNAFGDFGDPVPQVGDRVLTAKYVGYETTGKDGQKYRICQDKEIAAILF